MLFTLEWLAAAEGDCLLLHWGTAADPKLAIVDGGPSGIYQESLRPRLEEILDNRGLDQLDVELVMVSHVDRDHIVGVKELFRALKKELQQNLPPAQRPFRVKRLWHNTFNDILGDAIDAYYNTLTASVQASVDGAPNPQLVAQLAARLEAVAGVSADEAREDAHDIGLILAGHADGRELRDNHKFLFDAHEIAALNSPFKKAGKPTLITAEMTPDPEKIAKLEFKVVGPAAAEIKALQEEFDTFIEENGLTAAAVLAAYADKSKPNLSSIVCVAALGGKRVLLTGDARGDKVLEGLGKAGLLAGGKLAVEVLKVPHHGSDRNVEADFFEKIHADTYVISGDGKNGNPDRATLEMLTTARGKAARYTIALTYSVAHIDKNRKADFIKKGKTFSPKKHSLAAFFADRKEQGWKFELVTGAPRRVDLGDEKVTF